MFRVAVCDSDSDNLCRLRELTARLPFRTACECFMDADAFLRTCAHTVFDLTLLNVLSAKESFNRAVAIRTCLRSGALILMTDDPWCITRAFRAQPDQFLFKPVRDEDFFEAVQTVLRQRCRRQSAARLTFRCRSDLITLRQHEITYLEARGHYVQVNSVSEKPFLIAGTIAREEKRLAPYHFVKVHRSYLVNLHHVRRIEGRDVVMESGERIPISKGRFQQFYEQYIACVSAEQTPDVVRCPCEHAV